MFKQLMKQQHGIFYLLLKNNTYTICVNLTTEKVLHYIRLNVSSNY